MPNVNETKTPLAFHLLFALLAVALVALGARVFLFQQRFGHAMASRAEQQQRMRINIPGRRGAIYLTSHARSEPAAVSRRVPSCFADPGLIEPHEIDSVARSLSPVLSIPAEDIAATIRSRPGRRFVWLKREIDDEAATQIRELNLPGVAIQHEWRREYPNGPLAAHVIGFVGRDGQQQQHGLEGIEALADPYLHGSDGYRVVRTDAARRPIWSAAQEYVAPVDGCHVQLTLDVVIQRALEEALLEVVSHYEAEAAVGVVVDPRTGEVLALANVPTYDLNAFWQYSADDRRNRAITDVYEPGSIFKPFVAVGALEAGVARMGETFSRFGGVYPCQSGRRMRDASRSGPAEATFEAGVYKSYNTVMAQLGERMGNDRLYDVISRFGFGQQTQLPLPGESPGLVNPLARWTSYSTTSLPIGQEIGVTALQMAMGFSAFANDGLLLEPMLVRAVWSSDGELLVDHSQAQPRRQVLAPELARMFRLEVLGQVPVIGTSRNYGRLDGWTSFGKTGTAQIAAPDGRGYQDGAYTASYIAGAPLHQPRLVCLISVRRPSPSRGYYGGLVAAPAVKSVLEQALQYLEVPPDEPDRLTGAW